MNELALKYGCNPNQKPSRIYMEDGSDLPDIHRAARLPQQTGQNQEAAQQHRARHAKHDICSQRYAAMVFLHVMPFRQL